MSHITSIRDFPQILDSRHPLKYSREDPEVTKRAKYTCEVALLTLFLVPIFNQIIYKSYLISQHVPHPFNTRYSRESCIWVTLKSTAEKILKLPKELNHMGGFFYCSPKLWYTVVKPMIYPCNLLKNVSESTSSSKWKSSKTSRHKEFHQKPLPGFVKSLPAIILVFLEKNSIACCSWILHWHFLGDDLRSTVRNPLFWFFGIFDSKKRISKN